MDLLDQVFIKSERIIGKTVFLQVQANLKISKSKSKDLSRIDPGLLFSRIDPGLYFSKIDPGLYSSEMDPDFYLTKIVPGLY